MVDTQALTQALQVAADASRPLGLEAWLVLLEWTDLPTWAQAWDDLNAVAREKLLDRLHDDPEPLAGALLQLLAENGAIVESAPARQELLRDATERAGTQRARLEAQVQRLRDRGVPGSLAAAEEIDRVTQLQTELRQLEVDLQQDPNHDLWNKLEGEFGRLQLRQRAVRGYDFHARSTELEKLRNEVGALDAEKARIEEAISRIPHERDAALKRLDEARREREALAAATAQISTQSQQADAEVGRLREQWETVRAEAQRRHEERQRLELALDEVLRSRGQVEANITQAELALAETWRQSIDYLQQMTYRHESTLGAERQRLAAVRAAFESAMRAFNSRRGPFQSTPRG